ncbi:MAG: SufD family Fe-S cluster assembly protein [Chromatiales bacterium]|nr:SufD family Fe-S cluster assembly protein [Chromatiales bacterium]
MRDENQLHAAVVELVALDDAEIKYSTVQNWYPGDERRRRRHLQLRHQARRLSRRATPRSPGPRSRPARPSPGSTRAASCSGDDSVGEFYSVAVTNNCQQADTGTKMIHIGKNTTQHHRLQGHLGRATARTPIAAWCKIGQARRGRAQLLAVRLAADRRPVAARTPSPTSRSRTPSAKMEHEATTSKIGEDQLFYCRQRGI